MTVEFVEKNTCLRFARTYFLSNLSQHYMRGLSFYDSEDPPNENGRALEHSSRVLLQAYISLITTFRSVAEQFLRGTLTTEAELHSVAYAQFAKMLASRLGTDLAQLLPGGKDHFFAHAKAYDALGNEVPLAQGIERRLLVLRLQASHLHAAWTDGSSRDLGSVVFADTFFQLDVAQGMETTLNLTRNVPAMQLW